MCSKILFVVAGNVESPRHQSRVIGKGSAGQVADLEDSSESWLRSYLWSLRLDLSSTREGAMDLTHDGGCGL